MHCVIRASSQPNLSRSNWRRGGVWERDIIHFLLLYLLCTLIFFNFERSQIVIVNPDDGIVSTLLCHVAVGKENSIENLLTSDLTVWLDKGIHNFPQLSLCHFVPRWFPNAKKAKGWHRKSQMLKGILCYWSPVFPGTYFHILNQNQTNKIALSTTLYLYTCCVLSTTYVAIRISNAFLWQLHLHSSDFYLKQIFNTSIKNGAIILRM
jgi:hypothetical protein